MCLCRRPSTHHPLSGIRGVEKIKVMWNIKAQLQEPSSRPSSALFDLFRIMDGALDKNQNILKLQHHNLTGDVLWRPQWRCLLWSCSCSDCISDCGEQLNRLRNLVRTVLSQLLCYQWHVSVDDLREWSSKKTSFPGKPRAPMEKIMPDVQWAGGVPESHSWRHRLTDWSRVWRCSTCNIYKTGAQSRKPSGLLRRYITQAHILQSRKKPTHLICFYRDQQFTNPLKRRCIWNIQDKITKNDTGERTEHWW